MIESLSNPRVKRWAALSERKTRDREGRFLVEGVHLVMEALAAEAQVETIVYAADKGLPRELDGKLPAAVELIKASEAVLAKCTDTITPQGVFAVVRKPSCTAADILDRHRSLVVAVDGVQDPGNLGTIIRSADAAGASAILLGRGTVDLYNPKTVRSTMGSLFHLPVVECDLAGTLRQARSAGVRVAAATLQGEIHCYEADFTGDTWIVVGNEARGVSPEVLREADMRVRIPMPGRAESLNVAMATTVLLFEAVRQRGFSALPGAPCR